jgi:hypothetical protein
MVPGQVEPRCGAAARILVFAVMRDGRWAFPGAACAGIMAEDRCLAEERAPYLTTFIPSGPYLPLKSGCHPGWGLSGENKPA